MRHEDIPDMLGRVLSGTKFGVRQTRGKFGLGAKMALIWSKVTQLLSFVAGPPKSSVMRQLPSVCLFMQFGSDQDQVRLSDTDEHRHAHLLQRSKVTSSILNSEEPSHADEHRHAGGGAERQAGAVLHLLLQAGHRHP